MCAWWPRFELIKVIRITKKTGDHFCFIVHGIRDHPQVCEAEESGGMRVVAEGPGVEVGQISDSHIFISKTTEHETLGTIWDYSGMSHATPPLVTLLKEGRDETEQCPFNPVKVSADLGFIFVVKNVLDPRLDVVDPSSQMTVLTVTFSGWKPLWMSLLFSV